MSDSYTKLFSSIIHSTIWQASMPTKVVWVTMLAMADQHGRVMASIPGLAKAAGASLEECQAALGHFLAPDPYSRTPDFEGRRIMEIPGGWILLNYASYRQKRSQDEIREQTRIRVQRYRQRHTQPTVPDVCNANCNASNADVTIRNGLLRQAEAEAEAEKEEEKKVPPLPPKGGKKKKRVSVEEAQSIVEVCNRDGVSYYSHFMACARPWPPDRKQSLLKCARAFMAQSPDEVTAKIIAEASLKFIKYKINDSKDGGLGYITNLDNWLRQGSWLSVEVT
jgi:hypothetical protein